MSVAPPTAQAIVFLLWFRIAFGFAVMVSTWVIAPPANPVAWIMLVFLGVLSFVVTALFARMVLRGYFLAPFVLTVIGVIPAVSVLPSNMVLVVGLAADVLMVIFAWTPAYRAYVRVMGESRRPGPRLPYRYEGPQPKREDLNTGA